MTNGGISFKASIMADCLSANPPCMQKRIRKFDEGMRALGYYQGVVNNSLAFRKGCWKVDFDITRGPRDLVKYISITIEDAAHDGPEFQKLRGKLLKIMANMER